MSRSYKVNTSIKKEYDFGSFLFDLIMIVITGGLWIIWMIIRGMR